MIDLFMPKLEVLFYWCSSCVPQIKLQEKCFGSGIPLDHHAEQLFTERNSLVLTQNRRKGHTYLNLQLKAAGLSMYDLSTDFMLETKSFFL